MITNEHVKLFESLRGFLAVNADPDAAPKFKDEFANLIRDSFADDGEIMSRAEMERARTLRSGLETAMATLVDAALQMRKRFEIQITTAVQSATGNLSREFARQIKENSDTTTESIAEALRLLVNWMRYGDPDDADVELSRLISNRPALRPLADRLHETLTDLHAIIRGEGKLPAQERINALKKAWAEL